MSFEGATEAAETLAGVARPKSRMLFGYHFFRACVYVAGGWGFVLIALFGVQGKGGLLDLRREPRPLAWAEATPQKWPVGEVVRLSAARLKPAQPSSLRFEPVETPKGYTFGFLHPQAGPASTQKVLLWVRGGDAVGAADVVARRLDPSEQEVAVQRTIEGALPRSEWDRVIVARTFEVNVRQALALSAVGVVISALGLWKARALWRERAAA